MQFMTTFAIVSLLIGAAHSIDVETTELKCPGECPPSQPACVFYKHPIVRNKFYMCIDDQPNSLTCPPGRQFYPEREQCDYDAPQQEDSSLSDTITSLFFPNYPVPTDPSLSASHSRTIFDQKGYNRRLPVNMNKQMFINRLLALEERVDKLEASVNGKQNNNRPTMEISDEVKQQIASNLSTAGNDEAKKNQKNENPGKNPVNESKDNKNAENDGKNNGKNTNDNNNGKDNGNSLASGIQSAKNEEVPAAVMQTTPSHSTPTPVLSTPASPVSPPQSLPSIPSLPSSPQSPSLPALVPPTPQSAAKLINRFPQHSNSMFAHLFPVNDYHSSYPSIPFVDNDKQ